MTIKNFVQKLNNPKVVRILLHLIVLLEIGRTFYQINALYIISRTLLIYFVIFAYFEAKKNKHVKAYMALVLLFAIWALVTTFWSYDPQITFPRAFYFAYVAVGAAIAGYLWHLNFPKSFLGFLLPANIVIILISLFSLITKQPNNAWSGGCGIGFMGFAPHQNTLGMMILFTIPSVLFPVFSFLFRRSNSKPDISRFTFFRLSALSSFFYLLLLLLNLCILILTHSRGSILSLFVIIIVFVFLAGNWKSSILTALSLLVLFFTVFLLSPAIKEYTFKTESSIGDRRVWHINNTIEAAKHGGLIGLGFGISDPHFIPTGYEQVNGQRYVREKMIGVLALIEEVGVIGLAFFLAIIGYVFLLLFKSVILSLSKNVTMSLSKGIQHSPKGVLRTKFIILRKESFGQNSISRWGVTFIIATLTGLCFNAQIEAWWLGAGSWQFMLFFLIIGCALGMITNQQFEVEAKSR